MTEGACLPRKKKRVTLTLLGEKVHAAIDGNLCRCGCSPNMIEATLDASAKEVEKGRR